MLRLFSVHVCGVAVGVRLQSLSGGHCGALDVCFVSSAPVERHARAGGHPVPVALVPWIPAFAGMTQGCRNWQGIYEMDI
jgi:hypothetical protein